MNEKPSVLLVDDDAVFLSVLARAFERRGYEVQQAGCVETAMTVASENPPEYAVVDLKMPGDSGLVLVKALKALDEQTRIVMLTGYSSIATAVEAIKLGATHYLSKPADADDIIAAFHKDEGDAQAPVSDNPLTVERLEWEHIQKVLAEHDGNVSATARALRMHRRTLQRKLAKRPVKE
ncbi:MAG: response regulator transcription factor [Gammaproteobacteria bacterium]|nr:MAG: response regulator transcription factor [Gammaproteobacteria bacterium]